MEGCILNYLDLQNTPPEGFAALRPMIERAVDETLGEASYDDVVNSILEGKLQVWTIRDEDTLETIAVFATDIVQHARFRSLVLRFVTGKQMERWENLVYDTLERLAGEYSCPVLEACGRKGFKLVAKRHGFKHIYSVFSKTVAPKTS